MTPSSEPSITKKMNSLLITSLVMIILGGILLIPEIVFRDSALVRWGQMGAKVVDYVGWAGVILIILGPILTIFSFKWLAYASRSSTIGSVTKYLAITSFGFSSLFATLLALIGGRKFSSGGWLLLLLAIPLAIFAETIRRTILDERIDDNFPTKAERRPQKKGIYKIKKNSTDKVYRGVEQIENQKEEPEPMRKTATQEKTPKIKKGQLVQKIVGITVCPNCKMKVLPKSDGTCPSCYSKIIEH